MADAPRIQPKLNKDVAVPRDFSDYTASVVKDVMTEGVKLIKKVV